MKRGALINYSCLTLLYILILDTPEQAALYMWYNSFILTEIIKVPEKGPTRSRRTFLFYILYNLQ